MENLEIIIIDNVRVDHTAEMEFRNGEFICIIQLVVEYVVRDAHCIDRDTVLEAYKNFTLQELMEPFIAKIKGDDENFNYFMDGLRNELWLAAWDTFKAKIDEFMTQYAVYYDKKDVSQTIDKIQNLFFSNEEIIELIESSMKTAYNQSGKDKK